MRSLVLALALAMAALGCGPAAPPPSAPSAVLGKKLPDFKRRTLRGDAIDTKRAAGQLVVVKFFAKYCEPCKKTLPAAERLHRKSRDVTFIGIAEDEYQDDVEEMVQSYGLSFPIVHDRGNVLAGRFRVTVLPATFVSDAAGTIRWVGGEHQTENDLEAAIAWLQRSGD
jgi:peroxiredoxin